jgi:hypothetical protein
MVAFEAREKSDEGVNIYERNAFLQPANNPGIMKLMWQQGEMKLQKLLSRFEDGQRLREFTRSAEESEKMARTRAQMCKLAGRWQRVIPGSRQRQASSEDFQWGLNNRVGNTQPMSENIKEQRCRCGQPIGDGRHFRKCKINNGMLRFHDQIRDLMATMCRSAGLHTTREPKNLLRDAEWDRPADIYIQNWGVEGIQQRNHACDFSFPLVDSGWARSSARIKEERARTVGVAAEQRVLEKRNFLGTPAERTLRGNEATMQERCRLERINFWPIPIEGDGAMSKEFVMFINNVSDAAHEFRGHDRRAFKEKWLTALSMKMMTTAAKIAMVRSNGEHRRIARVPELEDAIEPPLEAQPPMVQGISSSREFRNRMSDIHMQMTATAHRQGRLRR